MLVDLFQDGIVGMIADVVRKGAASREAAAALLAAVIDEGGMVHAFGSGHSSSVAKDVVGRAGALLPVNQIVDPTHDMAERVPGYADALLTAYDAQFGLRPGEAVIVISNSGVNPLPVEIATGARARGLETVAIVNARHARSVPSRCSDGRKLIDVADVVVDTYGRVGDAFLDGPEGVAVGPASTIVGTFALQAIMLRVVELLTSAGRDVPILTSENRPDHPADARNAALRAAYRGRIRYPGA